MLIADAIQKHGAKAVYDAAHRHAAGDKTHGLECVGLAPQTMRDVWDAMSAAYSQMSEAERAIENAQASSRLDQ